MLYEDDLAPDCKEQVTRSRRQASRYIFAGTSAAVALLFVPWGSLTDSPLGAVAMPIAAFCIALAAAVVPYWPVTSATLVGIILHLEPIVSGTGSPSTRGLISLCTTALFVACGVFAWAPPWGILAGSTAVATTALVVRAVNNEPWMPSNLGMAVTTAVFSVAAIAWLSSKVFATGVDALVNRMHMRRHAFHSETLMRGGFPPPVARALLHNVPAKDLCREVSSASIAFIHLSDYDAIIDKFSAHPKRLVQTQDVIWTALDSLLETFPGAEKVETVGSAYLVAAGLVEQNPRHAEILAHFCMHVLDVCKNICGQHVAVSIGLHSGPVVGGIVGRTRAFYRVYGETVNVASRMMSHGMPATLHCSWSTATLLASSPSYENGLIELVACGFRKVKGIGLAPTFFVNYRRPGVPLLAAAIGGAGFSSQRVVAEMLQRGEARRDGENEDSDLPTVSELLRYPAFVPPPVSAPDDRLANQLFIVAYVVGCARDRASRELKRTSSAALQAFAMGPPKRSMLSERRTIQDALAGDRRASTAAATC